MIDTRARKNNTNNLKEDQIPTRRRAGCLPWLGGALAALVLLLVAGAIIETSLAAREARLYPPPGQMVDVGGYRLHVNCMGTGSPTVVIDAGLGDWSGSWGAVQGEVAKSTRVCTYDRAGMGWSEPGPLPRDARQIARELHTLLQNANLPGPYVMVAHSFGGLPVQVFTGDYPAEVAGVVLIESMFPSQTTYATQDGAFSFASLLARFGIVRLLARPLGLSTDVPTEQAAYDSLSVRPQSLRTFADEMRGIPTSLSQAGAVSSFGELPLIVLSRGLDPDPAWLAGQDELTQLSSNSQHFTAEQSDHGIQLHQPEAAIAAIIKMIEQLRGGP
jgi:pimeloyl-ACP methyl ester carboxylesterase